MRKILIGSSFMRYIYATIATLVLMLSMSCATGRYLKTETVGEAEISGTFTLFLYEYANHANVAVFDIEGDDYTFELYESKYHYTVEKNVSSEQAVKKAVQHIASRKRKMKKILDGGNIVGYEMKPLYHTLLRYGTSDILDVDYRVIDKKVRVTIEMDWAVRQEYYRDLFRGD
jgi:hypothetical protein